MEMVLPLAFEFQTHKHCSGCKSDFQSYLFDEHQGGV